MRLRAATALLALLLAPAAYAQSADPPTSISYNFRTGVVTFTSGSCFDSNEVHYRHATTGNFARALRPGSTTNRGIRTGDALSVLADRSYVEVKMRATGDTGCTTNSAFTSTVTYTAVTVASNRLLDESSIDGAQLTVTLGSDHAFGSGVTAASFELVADPSVSGLSISSITGGASGTRQARLTLGSTASFDSSFDLKVRVLAAAHNGAANLTSFTGLSVAPDTDYDTDDDGLIEISTLQQLNAVRVDLNGDGAPNPGNRSTYRRAFPGSSAGMGCPVTTIDSDDDDCTGYELTRHLDFDTDGDDDVDSNDPNSYASWTRIAGTFSAIFDGNGFNIANLTASGSADAALFENVSGTIRWLGLPNVNISTSSSHVAALAHNVTTAGTVIGCWASGTVATTRSSSANAGGLIYQVSGRVAASFTTANVSARTSAGGLANVLFSAGTIVASYATGSVRATRVGSMVRRSFGTIRASYATGVPTDTSPSTRDPSCFIHEPSSATNQYNYCDTDLAGLTTATGATGRTTSQMQTPTSATGIYANWDDLDVNGNGTADEDPWHFGTSSQHPVLKYGTQDPGLQRGDYDGDDDGLIEIHSLRQLNAMRWDLDGDGAPAAGNADEYASAFYDHPDDMGCPTTAIDADDNDCTGYELDADLDFDTDGDGATWALSSGTPTSDGNDDYHNGGAGWAPIGSRSARFNTTFNGNGHVVKNLFVNRNANDTGFFSATGTSARITALGLEAVRLRGGASSDNWGPLAGYAQGRIAACWATGHVRGNSTVGGLVGRLETGAVIVASYSTASVEITGATGRGAGLVSWVNLGTIRTSYSTGAVTGGAARAGFSDGFATIVASYWDTDISGIGDDGNADPPEGRSTAALQGETTYAGTGIYGTWDDQDVDGDGTPGEATDDDAWDFGANWQHPVLKFGGFDTALQFGLQPNLVPSFGASVMAQTVQGGRAMQALRIPAASGGNGPITYSASGLPAGLSFDADGTGDCLTARTICGTPSTDVVTTVTITAADADDNTQSSDQATLTFTMTVVTPSAAISATNPAALTEANLDNATVTVTLTNTAFASGVTAASFTLTTAVPGLSIGAVATVADGDTSATLTLDKDGADVTAIGSLSVTVAAAAHDLAGNLATATVTVTPTVSLVLSTTSLMLEEDPTAGGATNANVGTYTIALSANPRTASGGACAVTITASSGNTDVAVDNDGTPQGRVLQFDQTNWNVAQTVTVTASDDSDGVDDTGTIGHIRSGSGCTGGYFGFPTNLPSVTVNVNDDDTAGIVVDTVPATPNVADAGPLALKELAIATDHSASYAVRLGALPTATVTVTITSSDTGAVTVDDTQPGAGVQNTLAFTATTWQTAQTVTVRAVQDGDTTNETVTLTHAASTAAMSEYTGLSATLQATVEDDDAPGFVFDADPATPAVADAAPLNLDELSTSPTNADDYSVRLSAVPTQDVTVTITSPDTGAVTAGASALTFTTTNWNTPQTVTLTAQQDADGADESVAMDHAASTASNSEYTGVSGDFTATVDDDETPGITLSGATLTVGERLSATYTVVLDTPPAGGSATVAITGAGDGISTSPTSLTFTASSWDTARTVTVNAADDANSANEVVTLTHTGRGREYQGVSADIAVTATDDDTPSLRVDPTTLTVPEEGVAAYRVRLNTSPSAAVTVTVGGATAKVGVDTDPNTTGDQTTLTFDASNWTRWQAVRVRGIDDDDGADEAASLTHAVTGPAEYTGLALAARPGVSVTVDDGDVATVELSRSSLALREGGGALAAGTWTVRLAKLAPTGPVSVSVTSGDPAVALTGAPITLNFTTTSWRTGQTVTATAVDDDNAASERVEVRHAASGANYGGAEAVLRVLVTDDEAPPVAPAGLTATPGDRQAVLSWADPENPSITRYEYRYAEEGATLGAWRRLPGADAGTTSLTVSGLANGRAYVFEVRAGNPIGDGAAARTAARLAATPAETVHLADAVLAAAVRAVVGKTAAQPLTAGDLAMVVSLDVSRPAPSPSAGPIAGAWRLKQAHEAVQTLRGAEMMLNLRRLNLDNNEVADLSPLLDLTYLQWLSVRGNPLSSDSVFVHAVALRARGVEVLLDAATLVILPDPALRAVVEHALGKGPGAPLTEGDMLTLTSLNANAAGVATLDGLEAASRLESLTLAANAPPAGAAALDISALSGLRSLSHLDLSDNDLTDISALSGLTGLRTLLLGGNAAQDLSPLAGLTGLAELTLSGNGLASISALSGLTGLEQLWLDGNALTDIGPLSNLRALRYLHLGDNRIENIAPLSGLSELRRLWLPGNMVADVSPLSSLWTLERVDLERNRVVDVEPLAGLPRLARLRLGWNRVADVETLAGHQRLSEGGALGLRGNPLGSEALSRQVPALRSAGAAVVFGWPAPVFPAASDPSGRSGFVRVLNRSARAGEVLVEAVDDAGRRFGPARLALPARAAAHFNSADLERGNAAKGLPEGVGGPGRGSWRLVAWSTLDIEVLSYLRTPDGFLTAAHGTLPRSGESLSAFLFNPASNRAQASSLRVLNPGASAARVWAWGVDDAGRGRLATGFAAPAGGALAVTARQLESSRRTGRGLGDGEGKWRLSVSAPWPVTASSLLESPGGHLSNLSPAPVRADADGTLRLPLFLPAAHPSGRQGFARIANLTAREGAAEITAVDDAGVRAGPARLRLPARTTIHFNSNDLEGGNAAKGLAPGLGAPTRGNWRLELRSALDLRAAAYARAADGFLTSLHEAAPSTDGSARVALFNPASNESQRSLLRLINNGASPAQATITALDDAGADAGPMIATVTPGAALTLTAVQLEQGGDDLDGTLGNGAGKWRLTVTSDRPLVVMGLIESAAGHLSNLSATTRP